MPSAKTKPGKLLLFFFCPVPGVHFTLPIHDWTTMDRQPHLLSKSNVPPDSSRDTSTNSSTDWQTPMPHLPGSPANLILGPVTLCPYLSISSLFSEYDTYNTSLYHVSDSLSTLFSFLEVTTFCSRMLLS
jgi:hypothetical protein